MKKIIIGIALLASSSTAFACGWGVMLFDGESGLPNYLMASTTNGTSSNALFGMTSGTNGCDVSVPMKYRGENILVENMDAVIEDVARGGGDALDSLAVIYEIEEKDRAAFASTMHENFSVIFPNENVTALEVAQSMNEVMKADPRLAKYAYTA
jgi:hypothetical protein